MKEDTTSWQAGSRPRSHARRTRRRLVLVAVPSAAVLLILVGGLVVPVPFVNGLVARSISTQLAGAMACSGASGRPPKVAVSGGPLLEQAVRRRFNRIDVSVPDLTVGDLRRAAIRATLRDVEQGDSGRIRIGAVDASVTMGFADLPAEQDGRPVKAARSPDGSLTIDTVRQGDGAKGTVLSKLELRGDAMAAVPQRLKVFGRTIPARQAADRIGGVRVQRLPRLPDGVSYESVEVRGDGLHVSLAGTVTTPLTELPAVAGGRKVSYKAVNGTLAISPEVEIPLIGDLPVTVFAAPELDGGKLTMVPRSVTVLGRDRPPSDPLARTVLGQIDQKSLTRKLPALPEGVRYKSAGVDSAGIKVSLGGVTIKPFSALPANVDGRATTYGAQDGLLAATAVNRKPTPVTLYVTPRISGNALEMEPQQLRIFGALFPARDVFAEIKAPNTRRELQPLPAGLAYRRAEVVADGLRLTIGGENVQLNMNRAAAQSCTSGKRR